MNATTYLIGIDDTDNLESRGTGYRARCLGQALMQSGLARLQGITRHQLFVSEAIPYTSHNSSACLEVSFAEEDFDNVRECCRSFLLQESAPGSDAGLCISQYEAIGKAVERFARQAKSEVLTQQACLDLASQEKIYVEGLTGDRQGIIGALAAVGLHHAGNDGRFLWLRGLREMEPGLCTLGRLKERVDIGCFRSIDGESIDDDATIVELAEWSRPVLRDGRAVLFFEKKEEDHENPSCRWRVAGKAFVKTF